MDEWNEKDVPQSLMGLQDNRVYMIFIPNEKEPSKFGIEVVDTTSITDINETNVAKLAMLGLMDIIDEGIEDLVERGYEKAIRQHTEERESLVANNENVVLFKPKGT